MPLVGRKEEGDEKKIDIKLTPQTKEQNITEIKHGENTFKIRKRLLHGCRLVDSEYSEEVMESSRRDGVIVPLIVRPCHCDLLPETHYEIVDGHSRLAGMVDPDIELECLVRNLSDEQVLCKMYSLEIKGGKTAYWKSQLIHKLLEIKIKELGKEEGARTEVAKIINSENIDSARSIVSQFCKIHDLFQYIKTLTLSNEHLMIIKSVDKDMLLYLSNLDHDTLPFALDILKKDPRRPIPELKEELARRLNIEGVTKKKSTHYLPRIETEPGYTVSLWVVDKVKEFLKERPQLISKSYSEKEMIHSALDTIIPMKIEEMRKNPQDYVECYKPGEDGRIIFSGFEKRETSKVILVHMPQKEMSAPDKAKITTKRVEEQKQPTELEVDEQSSIEEFIQKDQPKREVKFEFANKKDEDTKNQP